MVGTAAGRKEYGDRCHGTSSEPRSRHLLPVGRGEPPGPLDVSQLMVRFSGTSSATLLQTSRYQGLRANTARSVPTTAPEAFAFPELASDWGTRPYVDRKGGATAVSEIKRMGAVRHVVWLILIDISKVAYSSGALFRR
jgi:hypothetical protein